jgi:hypothetical protein
MHMGTKELGNFSCKTELGASSSNGRQRYSRNSAGIQGHFMDSGFRFQKNKQCEVFSNKIKPEFVYAY